MKIMRKFSVQVSSEQCEGCGDFTVGKSYPVLAIEKDDRDETMVLVASDEGRFVWFNIDDEEAFLASIDE